MHKTVKPINQEKCVLYISYDGVLEPLGQSQVLQYLLKLSQDYDITLVTYEKQRDWNNISIRTKILEMIQCAGINWIPLRYHQRPSALATSYDLFIGFCVCLFLAFRHRIKLVHARSYPPSVIALLLKQLLGIRFVFDMRGFWADEKVELGAWPNTSLLYKIAKRLERPFLTQADVIVSLTHAAIPIIREFSYLRELSPRFVVIPTCTNLKTFCLQQSIELEDNDAFTLGYVGSVQSSYMFDPVLECFKILRNLNPEAKLLIVNQNQHTYINQSLAAHDIDSNSVEVKSLTHDQVPLSIKRMNAGIFFIKPVFSKAASAATKLGEFLGCGVPCLSNDGIGDMTKILEGEKVGVILRDLNHDSLLEGMKELIKLSQESDIKHRCSHVAQHYFSLDDGIKAYHSIYRSLT